jgi:hypothetical protein
VACVAKLLDELDRQSRRLAATNILRQLEDRRVILVEFRQDRPARLAVAIDGSSDVIAPTNFGG